MPKNLITKIKEKNFGYKQPNITQLKDRKCMR